MFPIGDEPNPSGTAWITNLLIAVNVLIFLGLSFPLMGETPSPQDPVFLEYVQIVAQRSGISLHQAAASVSAYDVFVFTHGFKPARPEIIDLFVSLFLHGGWMHLLGNMLFLWIFGNNVEAFAGRVGYLLIYLCTGVIATLAFAAFNVDSHMPLIGASGAISGILGCYFLWFPNNSVRLLVVFFFFIDVIMLPARLVLALYVIVENLAPLLFGSMSGVAYGAHLGGFVGGYFIARALQRTIMRREGGRWRPTSSIAFHSPIPAVDVFATADMLTRDARFAEALEMLALFVEEHPGDPRVASAHLRMGFIQQKGLHHLSAAQHHFQRVLESNPPPEVEHAAREALYSVRHLG